MLFSRNISQFRSKSAVAVEARIPPSACRRIQLQIGPGNHLGILRIQPDRLLAETPRVFQAIDRAIQGTEVGIPGGHAGPQRHGAFEQRYGALGLTGFSQRSELPNVVVGLLDRGHRAADVGNILGGNYIRVLKDVEVRHGSGDQEKWARLSPYDGFKLDFYIEFKHPAVDGTSQTASVDFGDVSYVHDVARARTFGFMQDVESLRGMGLARGGSLENAIVMDEYRILNSDGLRYDDEFVRHKILDAIGDLYLVGYPLLAGYQAHKSGHALNNQLLLALLARPDAYEIVSFDTISMAPPSYVRQMAREWALT